MQIVTLLAITLTAFVLVNGQVRERPSQLIFFELTVTDMVRAKSFYGQLFGWTFVDSPSPDFVSVNGAGVSGGMLRDSTKKPGGGDVKIFFAVDDVAAYLSRAKKLGATVALEEMRVSPSRTLGEFCDPEGNIIGVMHETAAQPPMH